MNGILVTFRKQFTLEQKMLYFKANTMDRDLSNERTIRGAQQDNEL